MISKITDIHVKKKWQLEKEFRIVACKKVVTRRIALITVSAGRRTFISCIFYNCNCAMSTNFGSSPNRGKKHKKKASSSISVRECRRHDVYSRLWTLRRVCYYPVGSTAKKLSPGRSKPAQWSRVSLMICTTPWRRLGPCKMAVLLSVKEVTESHEYLLCTRLIITTSLHSRVAQWTGFNDRGPSTCIISHYTLKKNAKRNKILIYALVISWL